MLLDRWQRSGRGRLAIQRAPGSAAVGSGCDRTILARPALASAPGHGALLVRPDNSGRLRPPVLLDQRSSGHGDINPPGRGDQGASTKTPQVLMPRPHVSTPAHAE